MSAILKRFLSNRFRLTCFCIFVLAIASALAACLAQGRLSGPIDGDGPYFVALARSMAAGKGYVLGHGPTANEVRADRLPLWPVLLVPVAKLLPDFTDGVLLRVNGIWLHGFGAVLITVLMVRLWKDMLAAILAGVIFATYPPALALVDAGYSEAAFIAVLSAGLLLFCAGKYQRIAGAFVLGLAVLARSNMIILPGIVCVTALLHDFSNRRYWKSAGALTAIFLMPASVWVTRNYFVTHAFPVLSTLEGETLYGANNEVVANDLSHWGYWIFPDLIPGETPKNQMVLTMSEATINSYYHDKAMTFLKNNWRAFPRLVLGKLVRGFVPVPWVPNKMSYAAFFMRALLYLGTTWALFRQIVKTTWFGFFLVGMLVVTLVTTVVFYGTMRFTFCLEPFLIMCVAAQLARCMKKKLVRLTWPRETFELHPEYQWVGMQAKSGISAGSSTLAA